jgi:hypothetical protein
MKTNLMVRSSLLAPLMVVLLLSSPLAALAQQISAEVQAKQDAKADLNKLLWIGTGFAVPVLSVLGCLAGDSLGTQSYSSGVGAGPGCGICVGLGVPSLIWTFIGQSTPPPERFIGKSPEYIAVYTDVYKKRIRWLGRLYAAVGCGLGGGLSIFVTVTKRLND